MDRNPTFGNGMFPRTGPFNDTPLHIKRIDNPALGEIIDNRIADATAENSFQHMDMAGPVANGRHANRIDRMGSQTKIRMLVDPTLQQNLLPGQRLRNGLKSLGQVQFMNPLALQRIGPFDNHTGLRRDKTLDVFSRCLFTV